MRLLDAVRQILSSKMINQTHLFNSYFLTLGIFTTLLLLLISLKNNDVTIFI